MKREITGKKIEPAELPYPIERLTYTVEEAAKILGICRALAYRKGVLPTVRIAGRRLIPRQALEQMLTNTACSDATELR
jgi:excisionase family DNA binding protein